MDPIRTGNARNVINNIAPDKTQNTPRTENGPDKAKESGKAQEVAQSAQNVQSADSAAKGVYGEVLDISEDGDTITARPEAMQALDDGYVILKDGQSADQAKPSESAEVLKELRIEEEQRAEERARIREEEANREDTEEETSKEVNASLTGYSDDMIDTLYRQGKIDSSDYNAEVDRRERLDEMSDTKDDSDTTQERIDNLNQNARKLGELDAAAREDALQSEAYNNAIESGRVDLMKDIFNNQNQATT